MRALLRRAWRRGAQPSRQMFVNVRAASSAAPLLMHAPTTRTAEAASSFDAALQDYTSLSGDPVAALHRAIVLDGDFLMAHAVLGMLHLLSTGACAASDAAVAASLAQVRRLAGGADGARRFSPRELAFCRALVAWSSGRCRAAVAELEGSLAALPTDLLALRAAHDMHFFNGDARNLRDSVARVFQSWDPSMPGYGRVCGMLAFGLVENSQFETAETFAMTAINLDPSDAWAIHAATHVYEMTARLDEGRHFLKEMREHWEAPHAGAASGAGGGSGDMASRPRAGAALLSHHLQWHWCLLDVASGAAAQAVGRYDNAMAARGALLPPLLDLVDDVSLLWRLELLAAPLGGVDGDDGEAALAGRGAGGLSPAAPEPSRAAAADPSAPVSPRYLAFLDAPSAPEAASTAAGSHNGSSGSRSAGAAAADPSPPSAPAATRWSELARRCRPYAGRHLSAFNDAHIAAALAMSGEERATEAHLQSLEAYARGGGGGGGESNHERGSSLAEEALWATPSLPTPLWHSRLLPPAPSHPPAAATTGGLSASPPFPEHAASADNRGVSAACGLDLAHGMAAFGRVLRAAATRRIARRAPAAEVKERNGVAAATKLSPSERIWNLFYSAPNYKDSSVADDLKGALASAASSASPAALDGGSGVSAAEKEISPHAGNTGAAGTSAAELADARAAARLLLRSRPHWSLLGCSAPQRDLFEQTLIHAAAAAGAHPLALALASERCTLRFSDAASWALLARVLARAGESARAADAQNRAYALGLNQKSA